MKVQTGIYALALTLMAVVLVAEATFDLDTLLGIEDQYESDKIDVAREWGGSPFKRGIGTKRFIVCHNPVLNTKCYCDATKPRFSKSYFYYCHVDSSEDHPLLSWTYYRRRRR